VDGGEVAVVFGLEVVLVVWGAGLVGGGVSVRVSVGAGGQGRG
jgi:hypothetical protein